MKNNRVFGTLLQNFENNQIKVLNKDVFTQKQPNQQKQNINLQETAYKDEIFQLLINQDKKLDSNYMERQTDINEKMRAILLDWIVDVHLKFKLRDQTLFLTQYIIDQFLSKNLIFRNKLQLLGIGALFIACKYEEIYPPNLKDFLVITDNAYNKEELIQMESEIMINFQFKLEYTCPLQFLYKYSQFLDFDQKNYHLAWYLTELSLIEYNMLQFSPRTIAVGAVYLVNKIRLKQGWDETHKSLTSIDENIVRQCAKLMCLLIQNIDSGQLSAVKRKFSSTNHCQVSKLKLEKTQ